MIEKVVIVKLKYCCKDKFRNIYVVDFIEDIDGCLRLEQFILKDDMCIYIKMYYDFKEEMMDYFVIYLDE